MKVVIQGHATKDLSKEKVDKFIAAVKAVEKIVGVEGGSARLNKSPLDGYSEFLHDNIMITGKVNPRLSAFVISHIKDVSENMRDLQLNKFNAKFQQETTMEL